MDEGFSLLVSVIVLAIAFDYINGFHDTANAIATVVSTNVLPPRTAVMLAAIFNFVGAFAGVGVAKMIGGGIADPTSITQTVVVCALSGAITWNLITWYFGIPSSSSHALVGGLVGAVLCHRVLDEKREIVATLWELMNSEGVLKVVKFLIISPLLGLIVGFLIMVMLLWIVRRKAPYRVNKNFKHLQLVSASFMALSHGSNDAQKAMGIVTMGLVSYYSARPADVPTWLNLNAWQEHRDLVVPAWVIAVCATAMALGTAAGGWRIMKTMGHKIIKLKPINGFAAESAGALVILAATHFFHAPVSTTHVISASIMGVGASKRVSAVRWGIAGNIVMAWVLTIPISALVSALLYIILRPLVGG
ncbi:MAG TPA: inorganic phosphate transporter [Planctomycetota bacterium]|nr:inorganic phosphate transporter [Planctomycetota bacterium]